MNSCPLRTPLTPAPPEVNASSTVTVFASEVGVSVVSRVRNSARSSLNIFLSMTCVLRTRKVSNTDSWL